LYILQASSAREDAWPEIPWLFIREVLGTSRAVDSMPNSRASANRQLNIDFETFCRRMSAISADLIILFVCVFNTYDNRSRICLFLLN
jgi:hypothetical protein